MRRIGVLTFATLSLVASGAAAQNQDLGGTVVHVDQAANTVTFADGRIAHYKPVWRIMVNGQEVAVTEIAPTSLVVVAPSTTSTTTAVVPGDRQPAMAEVTAPALVARVDRANNTITMQDGRVLRVDEVHVWRKETLETLQPGAQVFVGDMPPAAGVRTSNVAGTAVVSPAPSRLSTQDYKGRVQSVHPHGSQIVLSDGRTVFVTPPTVAHPMNTQTVRINQLRPGDEVVVQVQQELPIAGSSVSGPRDAELLVPSYTFPGSSKMNPDRVTIVRYRQSP